MQPSIFWYRTSGLLPMIAKPFFYPFKVYWEVCQLSHTCFSFLSFFSCLLSSLCLAVCFWHTEPNIESPLNSYAASLWNNQEGWVHFFYLHLSPIHFIFLLCRILMNVKPRASILELFMLGFVEAWTISLNAGLRARWFVYTIVLFQSTEESHLGFADYRKMVHKQYFAGEAFES